MSTTLDRFLSAQLRHAIETRYYAPVNEHARFAELAHDPDFLRDLSDHVGLYSDHGVVHVRDVAHQVLMVLETTHGRLIARRDAARFARMQGYAVLLAYFHDIGMVNFSALGRAMHPEFAAQALFSDELEDIFAGIWRENSANLAWHLTQLADAGTLPGAPKTVLREMLSLSFCHSKSKAPIAVLNDPAALQETARRIAATDLTYLHLVQQNSPDAATHPGPIAHANFLRHYDDAAREAYAWLTTSNSALQALTADVIDTLRALRCADAMRQRGRVLKTSGGYEILVDSRTANAIYALQFDEESLLLLETDAQISAGEANIAGSELDAHGDLRVAFQRGRFTEPGATAHAVRCAVAVIDDIRRDVIESFIRPDDAHVEPGLKTAQDMWLLLEETPDNPDFSLLVRDALVSQRPALANRIDVVPSLRESSALERTRYLAAHPLTWTRQTRLSLLARLSQSGHCVQAVDVDAAFRHVKQLRLDQGDVLFEAGTPPAFVYIPLDRGLRTFPLGGYQSRPVQPWMPLGATSVIAESVRSATVALERAAQVLMIPASVYRRHWHDTHSPASFRRAVADLLAQRTQTDGGMSQLEKSLLLANVAIFNGVDEEGLMALAVRADEVNIAADQLVFEKGEPGDSLYVVAAGRLEVYDGERRLGELHERDVFGEIAALAPEFRLASVRALADSRLLRLHQNALHDLLDKHPSIAHSVIRALIGYIRIDRGLER